MCAAFGDDLQFTAKACGNTYPPVFVAAVWAPMICSAPEGAFSGCKAGSTATPSKAAEHFKLPPLPRAAKSKPKGKAKFAKEIPATPLAPKKPQPRRCSFFGAAEAESAQAQAKCVER